MQNIRGSELPEAWRKAFIGTNPPQIYENRFIIRFLLSVDVAGPTQLKENIDHGIVLPLYLHTFGHVRKCFIIQMSYSW
jgi:hypothetical protein